jgi:Dynamin-like GTPase OPA1 C-terminal
MLRVIQLNTLEDRSVHDKNHWDSAIRSDDNDFFLKIFILAMFLHRCYIKWCLIHIKSTMGIGHS